MSAEHEKVSLAMPDHDVSRVLGDIADVIASRKGADPASSYVAKLFSRAPDGILKKVGEEAAECIMAAKDAGVPLVIAKASDDTQRTIFQKVGANRVVIPERDGAVRAARNLLAKNFLDYIELSDKISIVEINVKREWLNQRLADLNLRSRYGLNVIAVRRDGELLTDIGPDATFIMGDTILVVTDKQDLGLERGK